jgi:hypothetical protein
MPGCLEWSLEGRRRLFGERGMQRQKIGISRRWGIGTIFALVRMKLLGRGSGRMRLVRSLGLERASLVPVGSRAGAELVKARIGCRRNDAVRGFLAGGVEGLRSARVARG